MYSLFKKFLAPEVVVLFYSYPLLTVMAAFFIFELYVRVLSFKDFFIKVD